MRFAFLLNEQPDGYRNGINWETVEGLVEMVSNSSYVHFIPPLFHFTCERNLCNYIWTYLNLCVGLFDLLLVHLVPANLLAQLHVYSLGKLSSCVSASFHINSCFVGRKHLQINSYACLQLLLQHRRFCIFQRNVDKNIFFFIEGWNAPWIVINCID